MDRNFSREAGLRSRFSAIDNMNPSTRQIHVLYLQVHKFTHAQSGKCQGREHRLLGTRCRLQDLPDLVETRRECQISHGPSAGHLLECSEVFKN